MTIKLNSSRTKIILSFIIASGILAAVYACTLVYPFGDGSVLALDLNGQYVSYFEAYRRAVVGEGSIFYSWSRNLSGEFYGLFCYYLASPLNMLVLLFQKENITESIALIIILKTGLASASFQYSRGGSIIFSCLYGLSGYVMVQTMNPMWLDGVILLPLVILGIERLLTDGSILLYAFSLALTLITNFYIGYMTCIFCLLYVLYIAFSTGNIYSFKQNRLKLWRFIYTSVLACLCTSFVIVPSYNSLSLGKLSYSTPSFIPESKLDLFDFFSKMLINSYDTASYNGLPAIYCGVISLILLPIYFISNKDSIRKRVCSALLIAALVLSMSITTLDLIWHGFQYPNWMNYRYSYMLIFIILSLCSRAFKNYEPIKPGVAAKILIVLLLLISIIQAANYSFIDGLQSIWASVAFLTFYGIILCIPNISGRKLNMILLLAIILELSINTADSILAINNDVGYASRASYTDYINKYRAALNILKENDNTFYRIEKAEYRTMNDNMSIGINGITHSSSTLNRNAINVIRNLGYSSREHWTKYKGATLASDSLLGIKYVFNDSDGKINITENPYALNIIQPTCRDLSVSSINKENPFEYQNSIYKALSGIDSYVFQPCDIKSTWSENLKKDTFEDGIYYTPIDKSKNSYIMFNVGVQKTGTVYCFFPTSNDQYVNISVNGKFVSSFFDYNNYNIVCLGDHPKGSIITVRLTLMSSDVYIEKSNYFYTLDTMVLKEVTSIISKNRSSVILENDHTISGTIISDGHGSVYTSIPYEPGWEIEIDGVQTDYYSFADGLIAFDVAGGTHRYKMTYTPPGLLVGIVISALAVAAILLLDYCRKLHRQRNK